MLKLFEKYQDSINNMDKTFDKEYPINIISAAMSKSGELRSHTVRVPWKVVLDPDLTSKEEGDFWDASFDELSSDDLVSRIEKFDRTKLGIDFDEIFIPAFGKLQEMYDNANGPLQDQLEALLTFYFEPDLISSRIPESFWAESRESLRPFRDFLQIYRI